MHPENLKRRRVSRYPRKSNQLPTVRCSYCLKPLAISVAVKNELYENIQEKMAQEDAELFFESPSGRLRQIGQFVRKSLNDLEEVRGSSFMPQSRNNADDSNVYGLDYPFPKAVTTNRTKRPITVALSQPAPELDCRCCRICIGKGHGGTARVTKSFWILYF